MKTKLFTICVVMAVLAIGSAAQATFFLNVEEVGNDVVITATGSINLTDLEYLWDDGGDASIRSDWGGVRAGSGDMHGYGGISGPESMGTGSSWIDASSTTGSIVGITAYRGVIIVPVGYVSGAAINSSATWNNTTLAELGFTSDTYEYTWGSGDNADSMTVNVGTVPEPATMALLGLGGIFLRRRRRA